MTWRVSSLFLGLLLFSSALPALDITSTFIVGNAEIAAPASGRAFEPCLFRHEQAVFATWLETTDAARTRVCISRFQPATRDWSPAIEVDLGVKPVAAFRQVFAAGGEEAGDFAILFTDGISPRLVRSADAGATWTKSRELAAASEGSVVSAPALTWLSDGRLIAAWLATSANGSAKVVAEVLDSKQATAVESLSAAASLGDQPGLVAFPDGGALLSWRGITDQGIQDIHTARFDDGRWMDSSRLSPDDWAPKTPPADGPVLSSRGAHLSAAWFSATDGPRVNLSVSSNAGDQWLIPSRVDDGVAIGRPALAMLDDGGNIITWVEREGDAESVFLRRLSPRGTLSPAVRIVKGITGHPRLARIKDGDATPAELLLVYTPAKSASDNPADSGARPSPNVAARLITLPDARLLAEADACDCDPRPEDQRGYGLKGRVVSVDRTAGVVEISHDGVPGVMKRATMSFKAAPDVLAVAKPNQRIFAHIERIGPDWWLFNLRPLVVP